MKNSIEQSQSKEYSYIKIYSLRGWKLSLSKVLLLVGLLMQSYVHAQTIGLYDLTYTLSTPLSLSTGLNTAWDDAHTVATLQGIVNRDAPNLFVSFVKQGSENIDMKWWKMYRKEGEWLHGRDTVVYKNIVELVTAYQSFLKGAVVYDPNVSSTSDVASSVAGIDTLLAIRYDLASTSLYSRLVLNGPKLVVKKWLINQDGTSMFTGSGTISGTTRTSTGSKKNDPYIWFIEHYMKTGLCNTQYAGYYIDQFWRLSSGNATLSVRNHHTLSNHDFFVSKKGFFFDLFPWNDEAPNDDKQQTVGTDFNTLKELFLTAYQNNNNGTKMCYVGGFPEWAFKYTTTNSHGSHSDVSTEWQFSKFIASYNAFEDADAISYGALANASFWQHFPLQDKYSQSWITVDELKTRNLLTSEGKVNSTGKNFIIFYVGDYDAASWISQKTSTIWDDTNRGKVPLMWCISPVLQERVPHVMHYYRKTATANDYFAASDNGAGYLMPGALEPPRPFSGLPSGLDAWKNHCKPYYDKWGLTITGFIIDGNANGMTANGFDCYASFSPNGIVPQKIPKSGYAMIQGNMPILKADQDITDNDPATAAANIVNRVHTRSSSIPFHWFRNILKTPTWYANVMSEVKKLDPSIILLDAPAYFELLRIYLGGTTPSSAVSVLNYSNVKIRTVNNCLNISSGRPIGNILISSIEGKILQRVQTLENDLTLRLNKGIYIVKIQENTSTQVQTYKVLVL